jgi:hypothetical protein
VVVRRDYRKIVSAGDDRAPAHDEAGVTMNPPKKPSRLKLMPAGERAHRRPAPTSEKPVLRPLARLATS